jgi:hypothetical protein
MIVGVRAADKPEPGAPHDTQPLFAGGAPPSPAEREPHEQDEQAAQHE